MNPYDIKIADYTYHLPDERIARYPLNKRDESKLLVYKNGTIKNRSFKEIISILPENPWLIFNDSKVIPVRMHFETQNGKRIEIFCLESIEEKEQEALWSCMVGGAAKWKEEQLTLITNELKLNVKIINRREGKFIIHFQWNNGLKSMSDILETFGQIPIPPYLNRSSEEIDQHRYQNVFAHHDGSVAAPTAGLHFTAELLQDLKKSNSDIDFVTLHVGAGTFKPVKSELLGDHSMHRERISVTNDFLLKLKEQHAQKKVIAVGTTSLRSLESIYWMGCLLAEEQNPTQLLVPQWCPYGNILKLTLKESIDNILNYNTLNKKNIFSFSTELLIVPGYQFNTIDCLITNFHQPNSTLLLLVAAAAGDDWDKIYKHALSNNYRFLSYGDSSLIYL